MIKGLEELHYAGRLKELGLFSQEKFQGEPHCSIPVLTGQLQREHTPFRRSHKKRDSRYMLHWEKFHRDASKVIFLWQQ